MTGSFEVAKGNMICITNRKILEEEFTLSCRLTAAKNNTLLPAAFYIF